MEEKRANILTTMEEKDQKSSALLEAQAKARDEMTEAQRVIIVILIQGSKTTSELSILYLTKY